MVRGSMAGDGMSRGSKEIPRSVSEMSSTTSRYRCLLEECISLTAHCACQRVGCKSLVLTRIPIGEGGSTRFPGNSIRQPPFFPASLPIQLLIDVR